MMLYSKNHFNKNRLIFSYFCLTLVFIVVALRLVFVVISGDQVVISKFYDKNKIVKRGDIVDRNGIIVATDLKTKSLYVNKVLIKNPTTIAKNLTKIFPDLAYKDTLKKISQKRNHRWILIKRHITPKEQKTLQDLQIAGLIFQDDQVRVYPQKSILSHIIGYTDLDRNGISGIETYYDQILKEGQQDLQLAMDVRLQDILNNEIKNSVKQYKAKAASGIIMDVTNGEILALSSYPNFDPNNQTDANNNQKFNRATYGVYELGSVLKIFTNAIAFDNGLININDKFNVTDPISYGKFTITDDHKVKNVLTVEEIFAYSSNIGTVKIAQKIGAPLQQKMLKKFGLLRRIDSDFPSLRKPIYPKRWREINLYTISYGHGIAITPLHIASSVSAMVNGGSLYNPSFIKLKTKPDGKKIIKASTSDFIRKIMRKSVAIGTGRGADVKGYEVGGKTGTAERAEFGKYNAKKTMASFVATFPISNPKYLVFIVYDRPDHIFNTGGIIAAPSVGRVISNISPILGITPSSI